MNQTDRPFAGELAEPSIVGRTPSDPELVDMAVGQFVEQLEEQLFAGSVVVRLEAPPAECTPSDLEIAGHRPSDPESVERIVELFAGRVVEQLAEQLGVLSAGYTSFDPEFVGLFVELVAAESVVGSTAVQLGAMPAECTPFDPVFAALVAALLAVQLAALPAVCTSFDPVFAGSVVVSN